jgi:hypothetical protein
VEAIAGESQPRYRVTCNDVGCSLRIVVAKPGWRGSEKSGHICGRDTPVVLPPRQGLTLVHVRAQLEQLQDTFMS